MAIPTEPVGSVPRPPELQAAMAGHAEGKVSDGALNAAYDEAVADTVARFEATGSSVISDGEQTKSSLPPTRSTA